MHIDAADDISMPFEPTFSALPHSACGLVLMPAYRTLAAGSSFGASEALDAGLFAFVGQVVDVLAVLPLRHALVVVASSVLVAHTVRVADEKGADLLLLTKLNHLPGRLVAQIAHTPLDPARHLVPGTL